ncbi:MAG: BMP family ABC transporter substrate-binding protein [Treponema sp.]|nr:BMP family ABC transporter substrate-binding protein [Treponema sp.]
MKKNILLAALAAALLFNFAACSKKTSGKNIAVFVPGIIDDSPVYSMLVSGIRKAVDENNASDAERVSLFVMEAGTNQAEWGQKITALAAEQKYEVIISSNPSLPDLVEPVIEQFPNQKFILLDASKAGNKNIHTVCYNQYEQAYLTGYIGGLMSKSHKMALIAAQEYPVMNNILYPYFEKGGQAAYEGTSVDFRIVGNWYDATKGAELSDAVIKAGVDVILPICGGASQGVISSAVTNGAYVTWFDNNGFEKAPGTVISSTVMEQEKMAAQVTAEYLRGETPWGSAKMVGIKEGFVDFIQDDPNYISTVPEDIRAKMASLLEDIRSGAVEIK